MGKKREGDLMKVPYLDLKLQYLSIKEEINKEVLDTLKSSSYSLGPKVEAFEMIEHVSLETNKWIAKNS